VTLSRAQAKHYAQKLAVRFTYSTNGQAIYSVDMAEGHEAEIPRYPTPDELWHLTSAQQNAWRDRFAAVPFEDKGGYFQGRYYQDIAINRVLEAIAAGRDRILLTLATGTGKTFIAFQIAWKLFQSRWNLSREPNRRPRILFLADRNILANQAYNAFSAFPEDALVRIEPTEISKKGRVPKNGSIFFTIFQTFMSGPPQNGQPSPYFGSYPPGFFDFIVIDECHRGGANDESNWRDILTHFSPAVQLGLTATPKREENADTYRYFNDPVYIYSLKDGINDGFLTPFKVKQIATTIDDYVFTPDDNLLEGEIETGRRYVEADFNRIIEIREREAYRVRIFMDQIASHEKTLVFCATQDHALVEQHLRDFQDNDKTIPTILTTSQKLSTGVDARNIRNIVLMRPINTIYDFVRAHHHFNDPEWDGEPIEPDPSPDPGPRPPAPAPRPDPPPRPQRIKVKLADGKLRTIQHMMATSFWHPDGTPMSAQQFMTLLFGEIPAFFQNEEELRAIWSRPETRAQLLQGLAEKGFAATQLNEMQKLIDAEKSDLFDVLAYVAYAMPPRTREERATQSKQAVGAQFNHRQQAFLEFVLAQYVKVGVEELDQSKLSPPPKTQIQPRPLRCHRRPRPPRTNRSPLRQLPKIPLPTQSLKCFHRRKSACIGGQNSSEKNPTSTH